MGYDEMTALWDEINGADVDGARAALLAHPDAAELSGKPPKELLAGTGADHVLIAWAFDYEGTMMLHVVPAAQVDATLRDALATIDGRVFAGSADLEAEQWDAAVLVMSALAMEMNSAEEMAGWAADEGSSLEADAITAVWDRWNGTRATEWKELARPVSAVYTFRRAM